MAEMNEGELELELEDEFREGELEDEDEDEQEDEFGSILGGLGSLLGEGEEELEDEASGELEDEDEDEQEDEFGAILGGLGSLLGEGEDELEDEDEFEDEVGEQFSFGGFLKKALPVLKSVAKVAAPLVGGAILGPAGASLGKAVGGALEGEFEDEQEDELEGEGEQEMANEIASHPLTHNEAVAEMLAEAACHETQEGEAEAMVGAAAVTVISPKDRRALRRILPHLVKGMAILTRILRRRGRKARIGVKAVPAIMRQTVKSLKRQAAKGKRINRLRAARTAARQVRRVLGRPKACAAAIRRNSKVSRRYRRPNRRIRGRLRRRHRVPG
jgi:hypothetical protein